MKILKIMAFNKCILFQGFKISQAFLINNNILRVLYFQSSFGKIFKKIKTTTLNNTLIITIFGYNSEQFTV